MPEQQPALYVHGPGCPDFKVELEGERVTVGRLDGVNDVVLGPDPGRYVSGKWHCLVEREGRSWRVVDNGSTNGTFLRREGAMWEVRSAAELTDGDTICLLATLPEQGEPAYWELLFSNPLQTTPAAAGPRAARLEYDWVQAKLFRIAGAQREEVPELRPQVHRLLRYLLKRNRGNDDAPVLCSHDELIEAVWQDEPLHTREELHGLIHELRQRVELDPSEPRFVQTVRGLGFRLDPRPTGE